MLGHRLRQEYNGLHYQDRENTHLEIFSANSIHLLEPGASIEKAVYSKMELLTQIKV